MRDDCSDFTFADAIVFCVLQVICQRAVSYAGRHERNKCCYAPCLEADIFVVPIFAKEHIVIAVPFGVTSMSVSGAFPEPFSFGVINMSLEIPYDGAKQMYMVEDVDDREKLINIIKSTYEGLNKK